MDKIRRCSDNSESRGVWKAEGPQSDEAGSTCIRSHLPGKKTGL